MAHKRSQVESRPGDRSRVRIAIAGAAMLAAIGFAVPRILEPPSDDPIVPRIPPKPAGPRTPAPAVPKTAATPTASAPKAAAAKPIVVEEAGDLELALSFRWPEVQAGDRIQAKITFANHSKSAVYVPGSGEPNQMLAVIVEDDAGNEVRRIVETAEGDPLPRRLVRVDSGTAVDVPVTLVDEGEKPLPPGTYSVRVEMRADARLARLAMPTWCAPHGPVHSDSVPLVVKPAVAK